MTPSEAPSAPHPRGGAASGPVEPVLRRLLGEPLALRALRALRALA